MEPNHSNPASDQAAKYLLYGAGLTFAYFLVEFFGGLLTGSLALLADSLHMAGDLLSLAFAWFANYLARRPGNMVKTYGYGRIEVMAGLINAMSLWIVSGIIISNAVKRLENPPEIMAGPMTVIALFGLVVNIICAFILKDGSTQNLNVRGAYLHVLSDMVGSVGALAGGFLMKWTGLYIIDPIISGFICLLIIISSMQLILNSLNILLEGVPAHLNLEEIKKELITIPGIQDIHDLHIWSVGGGSDLLSAHLILKPGAQNPAILAIIAQAHERLKTRFGIEHATLQPEVTAGVPPQAGQRTRSSADE